MSQQIAVDVRTLFALADQPVPETLLPSATLEAMVREQFAFLPQPIEVALDGWTAVVTYPDGPPTAEAESSRLAERASRRAAEGDYAKAINLWHRALKMQPANYLVRRDLRKTSGARRASLTVSNQGGHRCLANRTGTDHHPAGDQ